MHCLRKDQFTQYLHANMCDYSYYLAIIAIICELVFYPLHLPCEEIETEHLLCIRIAEKMGSQNKW